MESAHENEAAGASGLPRRQFLELSAAALAVGPLGLRPRFQGAGGQAQGATTGARSAGFEHSGIFWFGPSFFDHCTGPWQPTQPDNQDVVGTWKKAIDWFADHGLNFAVLQLGPNYGEDNPSPVVGADSIRFGWGYHYVLEFKKFPEARTFEPDFVKRNQDIVRAITEYGKAKRVEVFTHHYNFFCPVRFLEAHPEMNHLEMGKKGNFVDLHTPVWDLRKNLGQDTCWNLPLYQEFLKSCLSEYLEMFPAAAGILATPGERARCQCIHCIGEQPSAEAAKAARYQDSPEKRKTIISFVKAFDETVKAAGRKPLVRSWIAGINAGWIAEMPKGVTYVTKYSVFDLMDGGPDPDVDPWLAAGHDMWFMKEHTGNENCGPMVMTVPEAFDAIAERSLKKGVKSIMGVVNVEHGLTYEAYRVQDLHTVLFANAFGTRRGPSQAVALSYYKELFGDKGPDILAAARDISEPAFQISRVLFGVGEGFTWFQPPFLAAIGGVEPGFPGTLERYDPPAWAAREIVPVGTYLRYFQSHPWERGAREKLTGSGKDPALHLAEATTRARQGMRNLEKLAPGLPESVKPEIELLLISSQVAYWTGVEYLHLIEAAFLRAGALSSAGLTVRKDCARRAIAEHEAVVDAIHHIAEACERLPPNVIDEEKLDRMLNGKPDPEPDGPRRGGHVAMREEELRKLKEELKELLG